MKRSNIFLFFIIIFYCHNAFPQYTEKDIYQYIDTYREIAITKMHEHKIPASITLAQGIFESGCGTSRLAKEGKNHFGIKCHKEWSGDTVLIDDDALGECFRKYENAEESFNDHSLFLTSRSRYQNLFTLDIMDYKAWAVGLKAAGYATNPQYAERLIRIIEKYNIAQNDTIYINRLKAGSFDLLASTEEVVAIPAYQPTEAKQTEEVVKPAEKTEVAESKVTEAAPISTLAFFTVNEKEAVRVSYPFSARTVYENNKTYFVVARAGDTYQKIATDVQESERNIRRFNDAAKNAQPKPGEVVYIEQKSKTNSKKSHVVQKGETLRYISQRYGIQLNQLYKYNNLSETSVIHPNDVVRLK